MVVLLGAASDGPIGPSYNKLHSGQHDWGFHQLEFSNLKNCIGMKDRMVTICEAFYNL